MPPIISTIDGNIYFITARKLLKAGPASFALKDNISGFACAFAKFCANALRRVLNRLK